MTRGGEFAGMTVNERLFQAGLVGEFDAAIRAADAVRAAEVLGQAGLPPTQARETVQAILRDPKSYGYPRQA